MVPIETEFNTDANGVLNLSIALGSENANRQVRVVVEPLENVATDDQWQQFIRDTAGSIPDPTFQRHPQGEFEQREELFP